MKCDQNKMKSFDKDFLERFPSKFVISSQRSNPADHNPLKFNTEASLFITFKYLETKETKHPQPVIQLTGISLSVFTLTVSSLIAVGSGDLNNSIPEPFLDLFFVL